MQPHDGGRTGERPGVGGPFAPLWEPGPRSNPSNALLHPRRRDEGEAPSGVADRGDAHRGDAGFGICPAQDVGGPPMRRRRWRDPRSLHGEPGRDRGPDRPGLPRHARDRAPRSSARRRPLRVPGTDHATIPPGETRTFTLELGTPDESFPGLDLSGARLLLETETWLAGRTVPVVRTFSFPSC